MAHTIIIQQNGTGVGGTAKSSVEWVPSHDLSGNEQMRRVDRVQELLEKIDDVLYAPAARSAEDP